jgi:PASTA domain-containing protein
MWYETFIGRRAHGGVAAAAVVAALFLAAPAHAVRGWYAAVPIGTGWAPKMAVNADGTAAVAWIGPAGGGGNEAAFAAIRTSGTWSPPQELGAATCCISPDIAVDPSGTVAVVWVGRSWLGPQPFVHAAVKPAGGAWLPSQEISIGLDADGGSAHVAFAGDGSATAIWDIRPVTSSERRIETAVRPTSSGEWQPRVEIGRGVNPDIAVRPDGSAVAVWSKVYDVSGVVAAPRGSDGTWGTPETLVGQATLFSVYPRVAVDAAGNATALWARRALGPDQVMRLESASQFGSAGWQPPETVATGRIYEYYRGVSNVGLAVNPAGDVVTAWDQWDGNFWVRAAFRAHGEPWGAPQDLSQRSDDYDVPTVVAADIVGNALALWSRNGMVEVSSRDVVTGIWTAPMSLSGGGPPDVAFDDSGDALAVWSHQSLIEAAVYAEGGVPPPPGPPPGPGPPPPDPPPTRHPPPPPPAPQPPGPPNCRVPRVVGKRQYIAQAAIKRAHCSTGRVRKVRSRRPRGRVLAQSPRGGRLVPRNTWVKLTVSRGRR